MGPASWSSAAMVRSPAEKLSMDTSDDNMSPMILRRGLLIGVAAGLVAARAGAQDPPPADPPPAEAQPAEQPAEQPAPAAPTPQELARRIKALERENRLLREDLAYESQRIDRLA